MGVREVTENERKVCRRIGRGGAIARRFQTSSRIQQGQGEDGRVESVHTTHHRTKSRSIRLDIPPLTSVHQHTQTADSLPPDPGGKILRS